MLLSSFSVFALAEASGSSTAALFDFTEPQQAYGISFEAPRKPLGSF